MSDVSSASYDFDAILGGTGPVFICSRGVVRAGGTDETLVPGCVLQADANAHNLEPWGGSNPVLGVLLEPITAGSTAVAARVLMRGYVKPDHVHIYGATENVELTAAQWNTMRVYGFPSTTFQYRPVGVISGTLKDEDETALTGITITLKDADGETVATTTSALVTGAYSFSNVTVGSYTLNVAATDTYYALSEAAVVVENATTTKNLEQLFKVGSIAGVCTDDSEPANLLEGVSLICYLTGHSADPEYGPVLSGSDGAYEFPAVRVGEAWIITASLTGHDDETVSAITVETDTETELDIVLDVTT